ncbi:MAG: sulfotransferase domain-containing protein [Chloroflexota bacterium]
MSSKAVIVVSGLPRSGTSMMMKMLEAGGKTVLTDNLREADANNPKGYYEFERVKQMKNGDLAWLPDAVGKVVKIVTGLITYLPPDYHYKVIFMQRDLNEVLSSQKKMLGRLGKGDDNIPDDKMAKTYEDHVKQVKAWLVRQANIEVLYVNYNTMIAEATESLEKVNTFLGGGMDVKKMASVVDRELYRERKQVNANQ